MTSPPPMRIGYGHDLHRLQPNPTLASTGTAGGHLMLGGVPVPSDLTPIAHSDGDVVLHALVDALLGAVGAGDIGDAFPNSDPRWKGAASTVFLTHALKKVGEAGYRVMNADVLILAERPKLGPFKRQIADNLARLLGAPANVKAGTNEGCDAIGHGQALAATAVVLLHRIDE